MVRAVCYRCHKPQVTCICSDLRRVHNRTPVWVVQHPRERFHPLGTARIARLGLEKVHVEVVPRIVPRPPTLPPGAALLYPGPHACELSAQDPQERPDALVVIDGTWASAHTLYRDNLWLRRLPQVRLTPRTESRYRLRKEPAAACVSTIEAIVEALRILEPATRGLDDLLASFDAMIDHQLALIELHRSGRRRRAERRSVCGMPRWSLAEPERIVVVAFEAAPRRGGADDPFAMVHFVALRVARGEVFQRFVRPPAGRFPSPVRLRHMGLAAEWLESGIDPAALRPAWQRFVTSDDIAVAWNQTVLDALDAEVGLPPRRIHLKSAYRSHAKQMRGPLAQLTRALGLERSTPAGLVGRAGEHVGDVTALLAAFSRRSAGQE